MSFPLITIKYYSIFVTFVSSSTISALGGEEKEFSLCLSVFLAVILPENKQKCNTMYTYVHM